MFHTISPIPVSLRGGIVSDDHEEGHLILIETYVGSWPTFTFQSKGGGLYAYLPGSAFGLPVEEHRHFNWVVVPKQDKFQVFQHPSISDSDVTVKLNTLDRKTVVGQYILTIDFIEGNERAHLVKFPTGNLGWFPNHKLLTSSSSATVWPKWHKCREVWV